MPHFAANVTLMYTEFSFLERFGAAAKDGFDAVEFLFPYDHAVGDIAAQLAGHALLPVLLNAPPGDMKAGDRGLACLPERQDEFRRDFEAKALHYAATLGCPKIHVMSGIVPGHAGTPLSPAMLAPYRQTLLANLDWAARLAAPLGITLLIEPLNPRDFPGYFLRTQAQAHEIVGELGLDNLKVQMDLYHCQITEGDLSARLRHYLPTGRVGHIQIAGVPDRHEPDIGELAYPWLFDLIDELGYQGIVSCEYHPQQGTSAGLGWLERYRAGRKA